MSFEPISQFDRDVAAMTPYRKRYLAMTPEQREQELKTVITNTNMKVSMSQPGNEDDYWSRVIEEVDRRIGTAGGVSGHRRPTN